MTRYINMMAQPHSNQAEFNPTNGFEAFNPKNRFAQVASEIARYSVDKIIIKFKDNWDPKDQDPDVGASAASIAISPKTAENIIQSWEQIVKGARDVGIDPSMIRLQFMVTGRLSKYTQDIFVPDHMKNQFVSALQPAMINQDNRPKKVPTSTNKEECIIA